jgi:F-type H+-transporting ATPase subunit epsilon
MAETLRLEVVTPERVVLDEEVDRVQVPGLNGELGILPGHTELVSRLKPAGLLTYYQGEKIGEMAISDGFVEVSPSGVTVLANRASKPDEIDLTRALQLKQHAEQQLQRALSDPDADVNKALVELERASVELLIRERRG